MMFSGNQTKVWTFMIQRDLIIPSLIIFDNPKGISIGSMDFDNPKVYGDTSFTDGLVFKLKPIIITLTMSFLWPFQPAALYITSQNQYQQNMSFCICRDGSIVQNRIRCQIIQWLRITEWLQGKLFDFFLPRQGVKTTFSRTKSFIRGIRKMF